MGYKEITADYVLDCTKKENRSKAIDLINKADAVITDAEDLSLTQGRYLRGGLLFRYSERLFKSGLRYLKAPVHFIKAYRTRKMSLLCGSAFAARDYALLGMYRHHRYKWGYFPQIKEYNLDTLLSNKHNNRLLWVGRLIDWKHPEACIKLAKQLSERGLDFHIDIVGTGDMEERMRQLIVDQKIDELVSVLGAKQIFEVRQLMEDSDIFLFTSDRGEGWGAVLNEAMNSACAVVAGSAIGSVPYLIEDGKNGLVFKDQDWNDLANKVTWLLEHPEERHSMGEAAYHTIVDTWNGEKAAENFIQLVEDIKCGREPSILEGPGSRA